MISLTTYIETLPTGELENIDRTISELSSKLASLKPSPKPSDHHLQQVQPPPTNLNSTRHTQYNKQQPLQDIQNVVNNVVQQGPPPQQQQQQSTNGIIKWFFPKSICQTQIGGRPMSSKFLYNYCFTVVPKVPVKSICHPM